MVDAQTTIGAPRVPRRAWIRASGIYPLVGVGTLIAACAAVALGGSLGQGPRRVLLVAVIAVGVGLGALLTWRGGAEAMHRRIGAARADWGRRRGWTMLPDGEPLRDDVALALPRGWRVVAARGRLEGGAGGSAVRVETWVLRALPGSRRGTARREIVSAACDAGAVRFTTTRGPAIDPLMIAPSWREGRSASADEPPWAERVRELVRSHEDMPFSLSIGGGRVVLLALDDPRPQTAERRIDLVLEVARLVGR